LFLEFPLPLGERYGVGSIEMRMNKPHCLQALEIINPDYREWCELLEFSVDKYVKWRNNIDIMPKKFKWICILYLDMILTFTEKKTHGSFRNIYQQCYRHLDLAKKELEDCSDDEKENAKCYIQHLLGVE